MMISLFFFFINEIYNNNIEYHIYIKSKDDSINIKIKNGLNNEYEYEFYKCKIDNNVNSFIFTNIGMDKDEITIESKNSPGNSDQNNIVGIYVELEKNCILEKPNNDLIKFIPQNRLLQSNNECYPSDKIVYKNFQNNDIWKIKFILHRVPNNCVKDVSLIDLTYDFKDPSQHQYNQSLSIELNRILKMKNNNSDNFKNYTLFLYNIGNDENYKLQDQDGNELLLNTSIQFRILTIVPLGEYHSQRKIEINFYTINEDKHPKSTLSTISFDLCAYGCKCESPSDLGKNPCECLENFAHFEDESEYCLEIEKLKSDKYIHYLPNNSFIPCLTPCNTCENEVDNCTSCIDGYNEIKYQNTYSLIKCCPPQFNYLQYDTKECTFECNKQIIYKYRDEKENICYCVEKCPNYAYIYDENKCTSDLQILKQYNNFIKTNMSLDDIIEKIDFFHIKIKTLNNNIVGDNYILQVYDINEKIAYNMDNITKIEFSSSFVKTIKENYNISDNESITVSKIDLLNNSVTNEVKLFLYDSNGKKINLNDTKFNNLSYNILFPLNNKIPQLKLKIAKDLFNNNIDCYNINDSFFHEICYNNYFNNTYYDLKDRSKLYNNITICSGNCKYISLKKEGEIKANCECYLSETNNHFNKKEEESNLIIENNNSTLDYLKCYKKITFKDIKSNASFWVYSVSFTSTIICAFLYKIEMLKLFSLFANPPKFKYQSDVTYKEDIIPDINSKSSYRLKNSNDQIFKFKDFSINSKYYNVKRQYKNFIIMNSIIDFDNLPYDKIKNKDNRNLINMFLKNLKEKIPLLRCVLNTNKYEIRTIKIIFYIMNVGIIYIINIILIGKNINVEKSNELLKFKTNLLRTIYIFLIYYLLIKITSKIYRKLLFKILIYQEYKNNFSIQRKNMKDILKQNLFWRIFLFIIIIILIILCGIYSTIYYYIYKFYQNKFIIWFSIVFLISFIFSILISLILSICRYLSLIYKIGYLYNINLLIKYIFDIY